MATPVTNAGSFSVGRDAQLVLIAPNGARLDTDLVTDFRAQQEVKVARSDPLNAPPIERRLPAGWRLSFTVDRRDATNDKIFDAIEQGWWGAGSSDSGTSANGQMFVYMTETNGRLTTYQYFGVSLALTNAGDMRTDQPVKQTIEGFASRRQVS